MDVMYEIPSRPEISKVTVTADAILGEIPPELLDANGHLIDVSDEANLPDAA